MNNEHINIAELSSKKYGEHTNLRDNLPSLQHRTLGKRIAMTDIDQLEYVHEKDGTIRFVAIIDVKHGSIEKLLDVSAIKAQEMLAEKLDIPFFIVLTYLDPEKYEVPMYYIRPKNHQARDIMIKLKKSLASHFQEGGLWCSVYDYSKFQHYIRKIIPNENEIKNLSKKFLTYSIPK